MLLSVRKNKEDFEVYDLDREDRVVAVFQSHWQAIQFMRRKERIKPSRY